MCPKWPILCSLIGVKMTSEWPRPFTSFQQQHSGTYSRKKDTIIRNIKSESEKTGHIQKLANNEKNSSILFYPPETWWKKLPRKIIISKNIYENFIWSPGPNFFQCIFAVLALLKPCHTTDFAMEVIIKALPKNV